MSKEQDVKIWTRSELIFGNHKNIPLSFVTLEDYQKLKEENELYLKEIGRLDNLRLRLATELNSLKEKIKKILSEHRHCIDMGDCSGLSDIRELLSTKEEKKQWVNL